MSEIWPKTWIYQFSDFWVFVKKNRHFLQNSVFAKTDFFAFLAISPAFFELQRRTIPHFNPLNKSFWPLESKIVCRYLIFVYSKVTTTFLNLIWHNKHVSQPGFGCEQHVVAWLRGPHAPVLHDCFVPMTPSARSSLFFTLGSLDDLRLFVKGLFVILSERWVVKSFNPEQTLVELT